MLSRDHCCRGKAISITYSERVFVTLVILQAKCMRRTTLSRVASLALSSTLFHKRHDFRKNTLVIQHATYMRRTLLSCVASLALSSTLFHKRHEFRKNTLVSQHAMQMRRVLLSSVAFRLSHIFLHCVINGTIFGKFY